MKCSRQLVLSSLAVLVLSACSSSPAERRQAKDSFAYLNAKDFHDWTMPKDAQSHYYPNYQIPQGDYKGQVGPDVDIRPPQQILNLIPGARAQVQNGSVTLWVVKKSDADSAWQSTLDMIEKGKVSVVKQSDNNLETSWIRWTSKDEDSEIDTRYHIQRVEANHRYGIKISLIDWRQKDSDKKATLSQRQRYTAYMTNLMTTHYDEQRRAAERRKAQAMVSNIPVAMGTDRSGLPVIIARAPYDIFWQRVTSLLPTLGFNITDRNHSQGTVKVRYVGIDSDVLAKHNLQPLDLDTGKYTLLLGDLSNRTSINVTNAKDKPIPEKQMKQIVTAWKALIDKSEPEKQQ
ncbi:outer membrane protein assembly factor BamC [Vibrio palustris]|uniref:Outer membrane protein assembly factor BamC n=1 Tax=Vibrio palustris TaxID=1918946 RepID=A0A1R4B075_9VIBR|nr:outer membrane protein assembly factor BamC [Vibrio palustris]SJL82320.1 Outer membrane protein assembly factor BamC precursor [Vibrio palustris]